MIAAALAVAVRSLNVRMKAVTGLAQRVQRMLWTLAGVLPLLGAAGWVYSARDTIWHWFAGK